MRFFSTKISCMISEFQQGLPQGHLCSITHWSGSHTFVPAISYMFQARSSVSLYNSPLGNCTALPLLSSHFLAQYLPTYQHSSLKIERAFTFLLFELQHFMKETSDRMLTVLLSLLSTSCCPSCRSSTIYGIKETQSTKQPRIQNELGEKQR